MATSKKAQKKKSKQAKRKRLNRKQKHTRPKQKAEKGYMSGLTEADNGLLYRDGKLVGKIDRKRVKG